MPAPVIHLPTAEDDDLIIVDQAGGDYRHSSILLYGKDLSGKTTTAATAGKYQSCLTISVEDGTRKVAGRVAYARSVGAIDAAVAHALSGQYQAIAFDTLDRAIAIGLEAAALGKLPVPPHLGAPIAFKNGVADDNRLKDPRFLHLVTLSWLIGHVRDLHAAPMLTIFTAHAREIEEKDKAGKLLSATIRLDLPPRFAALVRDTMDCVFYLFRLPNGHRKFFADTVVMGDPQRTYYAKDRTGCFAGPDDKYQPQPLSFEHIARTLGLPLVERQSQAEEIVGEVETVAPLRAAA